MGDPESKNSTTTASSCGGWAKEARKTVRRAGFSWEGQSFMKALPALPKAIRRLSPCLYACLLACLPARLPAFENDLCSKPTPACLFACAMSAPPPEACHTELHGLPLMHSTRLAPSAVLLPSGLRNCSERPPREHGSARSALRGAALQGAQRVLPWTDSARFALLAQVLAQAACCMPCRPLHVRVAPAMPGDAASCAARHHQQRGLAANWLRPLSPRRPTKTTVECNTLMPPTAPT